jgi:type I restriction enzyme S subunit
MTPPKYRPYPSYESSGIGWLGDIPEGWNKTKIKYLAKPGYKTFTDGDWIESPYITNNGIRLIQTGNIGIGEYKEQGFRYITFETFNALNCTEVLTGDVLICRLADPVGRACLAPDLGIKMITSVDVCILKPREVIIPKYLVYALSSDSYLGYLDITARGSTRQRVSREQLSGIGVPLPSLIEQRSIVGILDSETARLDGLIEKKRRLLGLLKEKRQAMISQAVTKGLDPNAPMQYSGIEWLGAVPAHWEVSGLKRFWRVIDCKHLTAEFVEEGVPLASIREVQSRFVALENAKQTTNYYYQQLIEGGRKPLPGDLIFSRNATVGEVAQVADWHPPFSMGQDVCLLRKHSADYSSDYLQFALRSSVVVEQLINLMVGSTFKRVNVEEIRNLIVPMPPVKEQANISVFIIRETHKLDELMAKIEAQIEKIQEYRQALISAAVTGKIDVREYGQAVYQRQVVSLAMAGGEG